MIPIAGKAQNFLDVIMARVHQPVLRDRDVVDGDLQMPTDANDGGSFHFRLGIDDRHQMGRANRCNGIWNGCQ